MQENVPTREKLRLDMKAFCDKTGVETTSLGRRAVKNSRVYDRLVEGKDVTTGIMDSIYGYIRDHENQTNQGKATEDHG